jgi:putative colanic acid biosynthesis acetyltransferase WcaF
MSEPLRPVKPFVDIHVSFGNRLARLLWSLVETLLYRPSPRLAHGWRRMLLRLFGARIGKHVHPYPRTRIWAPWNLVMDEGSSIDNDVTCLNNTLLHLGAWSAVSQQSFLTTASRDLDRPGRPVTGAPIHIGSGAWVAAQCFVGPGVMIGEHAVIGARSTITRDVAAMSVVAGSPPRLLRMRSSAGIQR